MSLSNKCDDNNESFINCLFAMKIYKADTFI